MKIDNVKFKKKVVPGDTLIFDLKLITPIRRGIVHMQGEPSWRHFSQRSGTYGADY